MIMRVYIRTTKNGFPETEAEYTAYQGFCALGIIPAFSSNRVALVFVWFIAIRAVRSQKSVARGVRRKRNK